MLEYTLVPGMSVTLRIMLTIISLAEIQHMANLSLTGSVQRQLGLTREGSTHAYGSTWGDEEYF